MGFKWILIGLIFLFTIPINGYDILPDFLGYAFISYGLFIIRKLNFKFILAQIPLLLLFLYNLYFFIVELTDLLSIPFSIMNVELFYFLIYMTKGYYIVYALLTVLIFYGIKEKATKLGYYNLAERAKNLCFLIIFFTVIISIPAIAVLPSIIYRILIYIIQIFQIFVIIDARQSLE